MKKIRYGVIGLGPIEQTAMLPAFRQAESNSVLNALISDDSMNLKKLRRQTLGVKNTYAYEDYEECLTSGNIDAIYIATPNHTHRAFAEQAAACGIHVLCEKPLAVDEASCKSMISATEKNRVKLMTGYRLHFETANLKAAQMAHENEIGELKYFNSVFSMQARNEKNIRLSPPQLGDGPLYDIGIYCINAARNLFRAEPFEVTALMGDTEDARFNQADEMVSVIMRFPKGQLATFSIGFGAADTSTYDLVGSKARIRLDKAYDYACSHTLQVFKNKKIKTRNFKKEDLFAAELIYFSDCILKNRTPEPSGIEGLADIRAIEAIQKSIDTRQTVRLSEAQAPIQSRWPSADQIIERAPLKRAPKFIHAKSLNGH